jgi:isopentenyl phosphate kinase
MIFLKLGGSLITDKTHVETARMGVISRLSREIAAAKQQNPDLQILLGHGSGSFGHPVADQYGTQIGAASADEWSGFTQVWYVANKLNRVVIDELRTVGLPALSLPPSASTVSSSGEIVKMTVEPIQQALEVGLLPVIQGDVAFDRERGSTILSTELIFRYLVPYLKPDLVLLAGIEPGVYKEYPPVGEILSTVTDKDVANLKLGPSTATDVTGGMSNKVLEALSISEATKELTVRIFSGEEPDTLLAALQGSSVGTEVISSAQSAT